MRSNARGEKEHHLIPNPAIRVVYRGVCLLARLPSRLILPPLTQLYSFHYYAPIVQKRFILAAAFPRHRSVAAAATQFSEGRTERKAFLSTIALSHLRSSNRTRTRTRRLRSSMKGYYDAI